MEDNYILPIVYNVKEETNEYGVKSRRFVCENENTLYDILNKRISEKPSVRVREKEGMKCE